MSKEIVVCNAEGPLPSSGRSFLVRVVEKGERHGMNDKLVHGDREPLLEFYDQKYAGDARFGDRGQFVSRYYAYALAGGCSGLDLDCGIAAWKVDAAAMVAVRKLALAVTYGERAWKEPRQ